MRMGIEHTEKSVVGKNALKIWGIKCTKVVLQSVDKRKDGKTCANELPIEGGCALSVRKGKGAQ